ncbi:MAG: 50S ribosomal protein L25 [Elusimicrobiales bacterium]|nr:50S ribosomal protein L25 [Elusimicrobiales bacterium]
MEQTIITAELREKAGVGGVLSAYRAAGKVPGVIYGMGKAPVSIAVDEKAITAAYKKDANVVITLKYGTNEDKVIIKAIQRHPVKNNFWHVDLQRIDINKKVEVKIPVVLKGDAPGVKIQGGMLEHNLRKLVVSALPMDIPHDIPIDITKLNINESIRVKDVNAGEKVEILDDPEMIVVSIAVAKDAAAGIPAPAAAPAAPEAAKGGAKPAEAAAADKK